MNKETMIDQKKQIYRDTRKYFDYEQDEQYPITILDYIYYYGVIRLCWTPI